MEKKYLAGYYDDRIFEGEEFEGKTPFDRTVDIYNMSDLLKLSFIEPIKDWIYDEHKKNWYELTEQEMEYYIEKYVSTDEIAGVKIFKSEEEALNFKNDIIAELDDIESRSVFSHKIQDFNFYYKSVFIKK